MDLNVNVQRLMAALELLRFKAASQMCEGKTTCTINERDVQEILFVAGIQLEERAEKEVEVM